MKIRVRGKMEEIDQEKDVHIKKYMDYAFTSNFQWFCSVNEAYLALENGEEEVDKKAEEILDQLKGMKNGHVLAIVLRVMSSVVFDTPDEIMNASEAQRKIIAARVRYELEKNGIVEKGE